MHWFKLTLLLWFAVLPLSAHAGAWPQVKGDTQFIISYEPGTAAEGFDSSGHKSLKLDGWKTNEASLYIDHGVTDRLSLTAKINYRD